MPPNYSQASRAMTVTTPLGPDVLLLVGFSGHEAISQLFSFELDLAAEDQTKVVFDNLLGRKVTVNLTVPGGQKRYFNGICTSLSQGMRGIDHTSFQMEVSPHLWLLTRRSRSRIFQNQSVPEILKAVLDLPDVVYELEGTFHPRTYCVQYRETDFNFASRLMEEEGIYYYFKHNADSHQMVVSNKAAYPELQPAEMVLQQAEGASVQEQRITRWQKRQQLRSLKVTLRDYHFQMPQKSLEAGQTILDDVKVGKVTHKLKIGESDSQEIYDWPGAYSHRFDAIDRGGADRPDELQKLLKDNERTAKIRMEQEAAESIVIQGAGRYRQLASGHTFTLKEQVAVPYEGSGSHDGRYVLTSVSHSGRMASSYRSGDAQELLYDNSFTCIPAALHYRPQRPTPKPIVTGTQTALVVGPKGEQIHTDKHGRVKVQFHWDREGKRDAASSCWIRVIQPWADKGFGMICLPRVGQEVAVAFEEGDPDRPMIVGSVYNADNPPPFKLPDNRMFSGIKTNSVHGNPAKNFSGLAFNDIPQGELVALYGEKDLIVNAENNHQHHVGNYQHTQIGRMSLTSVGSIPGIGGGGGGGDPGSPPAPPPPPPPPATMQPDTADSDANKPWSPGDWKTSNGLLSAQPGMVGSTIYGVNSQDTVGFMHQVTVGAAYQLCIDPIGEALGYISGFPDDPALGPLLGLVAGLLGNVQMCWGPNTQAVYGPAFNINHGPQINITSKKWDPVNGGAMSTLTEVLAVVVPALSLAYEITYAWMGGGDSAADSRAKAFAGLMGVIPVATGLLLASEQRDRLDKVADDAKTTTEDQSKRSANVGQALGLTDPKLMAEVMKVVDYHSQALTVANTKAPMLPTELPSRVSYVEGTIVEVGTNIRLISRIESTAAATGTSHIDIDAYGDGSNGIVFINGSDSIHLASGPGHMLVKDVSSVGTQGTHLLLHCGADGQILLERLPSLGPVQAETITLEKGGIRIDGGDAGGVTLQSGDLFLPTSSTVSLMPSSGITLSCGPSSISITQDGITISGLIVTLDAKVQNKHSGQLLDKKFSLGNATISMWNVQ
jgi:type VI secretion system secreted protein VgrG